MFTVNNVLGFVFGYLAFVSVTTLAIGMLIEKYYKEKLYYESKCIWENTVAQKELKK